VQEICKVKARLDWAARERKRAWETRVKVVGQRVKGGVFWFDGSEGRFAVLTSKRALYAILQ
jgi:hypothetical protein